MKPSYRELCEPPIRAVTFDMDGTLLKPTDPVKTIKRFLADKGVLVSEAEVRSVLSECVALLLPLREKEDPLAYYLSLNKAVLERLGAYEEGWEEELMNKWFRYCDPEPSEGAEQVLRTLKKWGLKLAVLTNNLEGEVVRVLGEVNLLAFFDEIFTPDKLRSFKPSPLIFKRAAEMLGVEIFELLHVGDNLEEDYLAALKAGAKAILIGVPVSREYLYSDNLFGLVEILKECFNTCHGEEHSI